MTEHTNAIIGVQGARDGIYVLQVSQRESDPSTEAGYILRTSGELAQTPAAGN
jgi:hypothetical protein